MKTVKIGIIGLGTIGRGVYDSIIENAGLIKEKTGVEVEIFGVCDKDASALSDINADSRNIKICSAEELIDSREVDIIVELIGGIKLAKDFVLNSIQSGKHVVTANKALLSQYWDEIFKTARDNGVMVNIEASVGGAIPIIRTLKESFVANNINTVYGILNGTTNFIFSKMADDGCVFDEALKIAQDMGLAESNPELDISGRDSAHKICILSRICFGVNISPEDIYTEGITLISPQDIDNARKWGYSVKLLAIAKKTDEGIQLRVHPTLLKSKHLLSDVRGEDNAVFIKGDLVGESLLFGKGAGRKPTSSSVIGDIVEIAKYVSLNNEEKNAVPGYNYSSPDEKVIPMEQLGLSYYFRFSLIDKPGILARIAEVLSNNEISIASVSQEERKAGESVPVIILTHKAVEGKMRKAIQEIDGCDFVTDKTVVIRMEE